MANADEEVAPSPEGDDGCNGGIVGSRGVLADELAGGGGGAEFF
jgi:hypothetical protein